MKKLLSTASAAILLITVGCGGGGSGTDSRGETSNPVLVAGPSVSLSTPSTGIQGVVTATIPDLIPGRMCEYITHSAWSPTGGGMYPDTHHNLPTRRRAV